jgi:NAD(P)-dependent dehydrogenase (short-subunit alcohol dehydrogenase family)
MSGTLRLAGRIALVTGAGGPMGRTIAQRFAQEGASLVLAEISGNRLREGEAALEAALAPGAVVVAHRADVTQRDEARAVGHLERFDDPRRSYSRLGSVSPMAYELRLAR